MITIECKIELIEGFAKNIEHVLSQITRDSVYGTFDTFPESVEALLKSPESFSGHDNVIMQSSNEYLFDLTINESVFPIDDGGVPHFVSTLAGELLRSQTVDGDVVQVLVNKVKWEDLSSMLCNDNINRVRNQFSLTKNEPLMGYSFKPRFGVALEDMFSITVDVLNAGFHIVEPDTRRILLDSEREDLIEFANGLPGVHDRANRAFALNLSNRTKDLPGIISLLAVDKGGPTVVKIDGGLDGLSLMQRAKQAAALANSEIVVTCYPLIKKILENKVPSDFLNLAFAACGADIMYPSGRANIHNEVRNYEGHEQNLIEASRKKYLSHLADQKFIPTIAGGVTPGQLHIFYELYGPNVSFFLGGAVALHANGPGAGAKLCKNILDHAAEFRTEFPDNQINIKSIPDSLQREISENYSRTDYLEPSVFFSKNKEVVNKFNFER